MLHFPVLLEESIDFLVQKVDGNFIDCTYGRGGHSSAILDKLTKNGHLTSFDKDPEAYEHAANISENNFTPIHSSFNNINKYFSNNSVDGILYDLGTCSTHFDDGGRGFSFKNDGPLDMRFNSSKGDPLSVWINEASQEEIMEVLYKYGDEKHGKLIAKKIIEFRKIEFIKTTLQLSQIIQDIYPEKKIKTHPATKSFQAFRIFINNELNELEESLSQASKIIKKDGVIVVISFHSLEDNIVKSFF
ncbi:16S rRNA (cytosine(1402)-N(4))-methyltransferase RsmH [Gammaproteobacteria bacterium]|nr:16S rRNA (cytosine(1402)-N(4))-methyltransferase RsmH [Gammaproteobacteria bacterium]